MNLFRQIANRFSFRGRALAQVDKGMASAKKDEAVDAIRIYSDVITSKETPRDVMAMALFNRALAYTTTGQLRQATEDLRAVLNMPETMSKIKKSASDKLVRMERKLKRKETSDADSGGEA